MGVEGELQWVWAASKKNILVSGGGACNLGSIPLWKLFEFLSRNVVVREKPKFSTSLALWPVFHELKTKIRGLQSFQTYSLYYSLSFLSLKISKRFFFHSKIDKKNVIEAGGPLQTHKEKKLQVFYTSQKYLFFYGKWWQSFPFFWIMFILHHITEMTFFIKKFFLCWGLLQMIRQFIHNFVHGNL